MKEVIITIILTVLVITAMVYIRPFEKNVEGRLYDYLSPSVAYVQVYENYDDEYPIAEGSGFLIEDGVLMTAKHVVIDAAKIDIYFPDVNKPYTSSNLVAVDSNDDVGFVYFESDSNCPGPLEFDDDTPYCGMDVICIGSPLGACQFNTISKGILSGTERMPEWYEGEPLYQMDAPATFGNSGCPVFDMEGEVIGMVVSGRTLADICFLVTDDVLEDYANKVEMP